MKSGAAMLFLVVFSLTTVARDRKEQEDKASSQPAFEVASVRPNTSGATRAVVGLPKNGPVTISNATLRQIILQAYGISPAMARFKVVGGSDRILTTRFDIQAKPPANAPEGQSQLMLRALLAGRFNLRTRTELRQMPVFAVTVARQGTLGPQLRPSTYDCAAFAAAVRERKEGEPRRGSDKQPWCIPSPGPSGSLHLRGAAPLGILIDQLQAFVDLPLTDMTGLTGNFEWEVTFSTFPDNLNIAAPPIQAALSQQLGLTLERRSGPVEVLIIESVQMPTEN